MPDLPPYGNPGALVADNVIPAANSYRSFPNQVVASNSLGGRVQGAIFARDAAQNVYNYAGDASALYRLVAGSFTVATRLVGGAYSTPSDDFWEFIQWGETVIGVNGSNGDTPQQISLGAANFFDLSGAPKARHIAVINNFVVLGNISDSVVGVQRVRWSAINDATNWSVNAATLADYQDLLGDGGWIQKIVGGEGGGYVLQEHAIWRMTFVGSPLIFQFDKIKTGIGAYAPQSVISFLGMTFFLGNDGFYMFDGSNVTPIGQNKVDNTFFDDLDNNYIDRIVGAIDPNRKIVLWSYPGIGNTGGNPNRVLVYHWALNRWSRVVGIGGVGGSGFNLEFIISSISPGYTLDGLDAVSTNIDTLPYSLDSAFWTGGQLNISVFNSGHQLATLNGSALPAIVQTGEINLIQGRKAYITEVWPLVEGNSASCQVSVISRDVLTQSVSTGLAMSPTSQGFAEVRNIARYHRFQLTTITGTEFDNLQGIMSNPIDGGAR